MVTNPNENNSQINLMYISLFTVKSTPKCVKMNFEMLTAICNNRNKL